MSCGRPDTHLSLALSPGPETEAATFEHEAAVSHRVPNLAQVGSSNEHIDVLRETWMAVDCNRNSSAHRILHAGAVQRLDETEQLVNEVHAGIVAFESDRSPKQHEPPRLRDLDQVESAGNIASITNGLPFAICVSARPIVSACPSVYTNAGRTPAFTP